MSTACSLPASSFHRKQLLMSTGCLQLITTTTTCFCHSLLTTILIYMIVAFLLQSCKEKEVDMSFEVLAGNHSVFAALAKWREDVEEDGEQEIPEKDIRYRKATVFKSSDLTPTLRVILAGGS